MGKFQCICGAVISTSGEIPNPNEWRALSDVQFDDFQGEVDAESVYRAATIFYRCPVSDHLWIFWDGIENSPSLYGPLQLPK